MGYRCSECTGFFESDDPLQSVSYARNKHREVVFCSVECMNKFIEREDEYLAKNQEQLRKAAELLVEEAEGFLVEINDPQTYVDIWEQPIEQVLVMQFEDLQKAFDGLKEKVNELRQ